MIDKRVDTMAAALEGARDGMTMLIGGFGSVGQPDYLLDGLMDMGVRELTIVVNNAGSGGVGVERLLSLERVRKIICSYPRSAGSTVFEELFRAGKIELELVPQGTLAERLRAAGAGIPAFWTPTAAGTQLADSKETRDFGGRAHVLEHALHGDFALIEAWEADRLGNCTYRRSGRNFNPIMATAAPITVAQAHHRREAGEIDPERIVTPGIFVDRVLYMEPG